MFNNKLFSIFLNRLNGIPVYRSSEEKSKLRNNFETIERCKNILQNDGIIIIFAEGQTLHDWNLKPIKSGVSKIVRHAITDEYLRNTLAVVPVGLTYSDYTHPAKTIIIKTGDTVYPGQIDPLLSDGAWKQTFNIILFENLRPLVPCMRSEKTDNIQAWQIAIKSLNKNKVCDNINTLHHIGHTIEHCATIPKLTHITRQYLITAKADFYKSLFTFLLFILPGTAGLILNGLYYFPVSRWAYIKTKDSIFYDALLCGLITITYPIYIFMTAIALHIITPLHFLIWLPLFPFTGWCTVYAYTLLLEVKNYLCIPAEEKRFLDKILL